MEQSTNLQALNLITSAARQAMLTGDDHDKVVQAYQRLKAALEPLQEQPECE